MSAERRRAQTQLGDEGLLEVLTVMDELARGDGRCVLGDIATAHLSTGGKRMRARLALAATEALGAERRRAVPWAAAVELVHNASLIHDDLEDGDEKRRGRPTVWVRHGAAQAINAGDLLLALPYRAAVRTEAADAVRWRLCESLAHAVERMARGQSAELEMLERLSRTARLEREYLQCARDKTGALFAATVEGAALLAGRSPADASELSEALLPFGVLFQLQDDVLDLFGDKGRGRRGNDLREGKVSALVVEHLRLHPDERSWLCGLLSAPRACTSDEAVDEAIARFEHGGALERCLGRMGAIAEELVGRAARLAPPAFAALTAEIVGVVLSPIQGCFNSSVTVVSTPRLEARS